MKQALHLNLGQQLTLTPQLQQAIRLLQLSTLDLNHEIQDALEQNPLLESVDENEANTVTDNTQQSSNEEEMHSLNMERETIPEDLPVDTAWEDALQVQNTPKSLADTPDSNIYENTHSEQEDLQSHLMQQLSLETFTESDHVIATALIDAINEQGFLSCPIEEIQECITEASDEESISYADIECVLQKIQNLEPIGVGARNLKECLLIQLRQLPEETEWRDLAIDILEHHFQLLASRDNKLLQRKLKLDETQLRQALLLIQSLDPRPGTQVSDEETKYVIPDVIVSKHKDRWLVELNSEATPKLRINSNYSNLIGRDTSSDDNSYLRNHLQEARWLIKSLRSRNETLLKVASCIFEIQKDFLENGDTAMKPLVLNDIAEAIGMHESTISRVTTQKYAETPRGIFELKYFFSSHVGTSDGGECSATAIRARIKSLISDEDSHKPLSDSKISKLLEAEGIQVARRTVAKYREAMHIPPSNERKSIV